MMIPWLTVQFGINYTRKVSNFTRLCLMNIQTLLMQLIPNCTANHGITYHYSHNNGAESCEVDQWSRFQTQPSHKLGVQWVDLGTRLVDQKSKKI